MSAKKKSGRVIDLRGKRSAPTRTQGQLPLFEKRHVPLRARRRRKRAIFALCAVLVSAGAAWGLHYASYLPQFSINSVEVVGAKEISPVLVESFVEAELSEGAYTLLSRKNIFVYPRSALARATEAYFPRISSVDISRESFLAQAIIVTVDERQPFATWCSESGACYLLDDGGFIFTALENYSETGDSTTTEASYIATKYTFTGEIKDFEGSPVGQTFLPGHFVNARTFLESLERAGFLAQKISVDNEEDISVLLTRGFAIRASLVGDVESTMRNLELVLSSDSLRGKEEGLLYIDLRFGNKVYYKFKEE